MTTQPETPLVSVIVGCYNVADFMDDGIRTILAQTYPHFELILVDDGSTDSTGAKFDVLAKHDGRVKVIHKKNEGVGSARNTGLQAAQGSYLYFCDCDDKAEPDLLQRLVTDATRYRTDMIIFSMDVISVQDGTVDKIRFDDLMLESNEAIKDVFCDKIFFSKHGNGFVWNKFYTRAFLERAHARFGTERIQQDEPFNLRLYPQAQRLLLSSYKGYNYFYNPKVSTAAKFVERKYEAIRSVYDALKHFQHEWHLSSPRFAAAAEKRFHNSVLNVLFTNFSPAVCPWPHGRIQARLLELLQDADVQNVLTNAVSAGDWRSRLLCNLLKKHHFRALFATEWLLSAAAKLYHQIR